MVSLRVDEHPLNTSTLQTANNQARQAKRLSFFHVPNGIIMDRFTPSAVGSNFELTPILDPLSAFKEAVTHVGRGGKVLLDPRKT